MSLSEHENTADAENRKLLVVAAVDSAVEAFTALALISSGSDSRFW